MIGQAKFAYSPLGKAFKKQAKAIENQGKKIDAITNQNKRLEALTNKDYQNVFTKKYLINYLKKNLMK